MKGGMGGEEREEETDQLNELHDTKERSSYGN